MPVFPERESTLVNRLHSRGDSAQDKRTWIIGHSADNREREAERFKGFRKGTGDSNGALANVEESRQPPAPAALLAQSPSSQSAGPVARARSQSTGIETMMGASSSSNTADDIMASLADLDLSSGATAAIQEEPLLPSSSGGLTQSPPQMQSSQVTSLPVPAYANGSEGMKDIATLGGVAPSLLAPLTVAPNIEKVSAVDSSMSDPADSQWLERLSYSSEGILYEDDTIQIGVKSEYHAALGRLALFFGNKLDTSLADVRMTIEYPNSVTQTGLDIRFHDAPVTEIKGKAQVQEMLHVECKGFFSDPPVLRMTYEVASGVESHGKRTLVLRLPVFLTRFVEGVTLEQGPFFERWKIIGGELAEYTEVTLVQETDARRAERSAEDLPDQVDAGERGGSCEDRQGHVWQSTIRPLWHRPEPIERELSSLPPGLVADGSLSLRACCI